MYINKSLEQWNIVRDGLMKADRNRKAKNLPGIIAHASNRAEVTAREIERAIEANLGEGNFLTPIIAMRMALDVVNYVADNAINLYEKHGSISGQQVANMASKLCDEYLYALAAGVQEKYQRKQIEQILANDIK